MPTEEEKKKAQAGQNGQVKPGNANVNDRSEDQQGKAAPPQPAQHRSIDVTVVAGDGMLGGDDLRLRGRGMSPARGRGGYGYGGGNVYGRNSGFAPDDTRNPGYYSSGAIAARREQDRAAREERQAKFNAVADRMNAATARRDAKEASDRAARRASEAAKYTIDAAAWGEMGRRNGQIREERTELTNDDGSLKLDKNGEPQVEVKKFRNEGSMLDAEANKDAIAGMNQWWKEYGQYDQRLGAAKGAFNDKGELDASKLTADQFAELQRVKGNFDAKHKPIQDRIRLHEAENRMRDTDYLQNKGVQVWDTKTGERKLTPEQAQSMARKMRLEEAYGSLRDLADPAHFQEGGKYSGRRGGIEGERDAAVAELLGDDVAAVINGTGADRRLADEASMMRRMRDLGFSADQIADKKGNIDLGRVEAALRGTPEISKILTDARAARAVQAEAVNRAVARSKAEVQRGMEAHRPTVQQEADAELRAQATAPSAVPGGLAGDLSADLLKNIPSVADLTPARPKAETGPAEPSTEPGEPVVSLPGEGSPEVDDALALSAALSPAALRDPVVQRAINRRIAEAGSPAEPQTARGFTDRLKEAFRASFGAGAERPAMTVGMPGMLPVTQRERMSPAGRQAERDALMFSGEMIAGSAFGGAVSAGLRRGLPALASRATARVAANPGVRRAITAETPTTARATLDAVKNFGRSPAKMRAARDAAQRAADIRKANAAAEAAKTGTEKTLDAVGKFWSRAGKKARPRRAK